jgi:hypothetical protein
MKPSIRRSVVIFLVCVLAAVSSGPARAQIGVSNAQATVAGVAIVAVAVGIGVVVYFTLRQSPTITGCAVTAANGLNLASEGERQTFLLTGDTADIKPGDRVKLKGKRQKKDAAGNRPFLVSNLKEDYGACTMQPATPAPPPRR